MKIEKRYHFYAAHRNIHADAKCARIHGHTYILSAEFYFDSMGKGGVCMLFSDIDKIVEPIVKAYDHHLLLAEWDILVNTLNEINEPYITLPFDTSAENMCIHFWKLIKKQIPELIKIKLQETQSSIVTYEG